MCAGDRRPDGKLEKLKDDRAAYGCCGLFLLTWIALLWVTTTHPAWFKIMSVGP